MAEQCNWDPKKHGGRPCPKHGNGGLWDENVLARKSKLKEAGYEDADLEDEDLKEDFDDDYEEEFYTKEELKNKFGTDNLDIINAGNEKTIKLKEEPKGAAAPPSNPPTNGEGDENEKELEQPTKRTKVAGIKERAQNSVNLLTDFVNDYIDDDEASTLKDKLQFVKKDFESYYDGWKHRYPSQQEAFTHYLMDSGLGSAWYDDIYDDLVKIGYVDDEKFKENTDKLEQLYGFNLYKAYQKLLEQE